MRGIFVETSGDVTVIEDVNSKVIKQLLGEQYGKTISKDEMSDVFLHELNVVADLPINVHASVDAGIVLGGPVVIVPRSGSKKAKDLFTASYHQAIQKQNSDHQMLSRLETLLKQNRNQLNFKFYEDRWLYNGKAFEAIIVSEAEDHMEDGVASYLVWFFSPERKDPCLLQIVEFSLREVMEGMILDDESTANGNPPGHFRRILEHFGRSA